AALARACSTPPRNRCRDRRDHSVAVACPGMLGGSARPDRCHSRGGPAPSRSRGFAPHTARLRLASYKSIPTIQCPAIRGHEPALILARIARHYAQRRPLDAMGLTPWALVGVVGASVGGKGPWTGSLSPMLCASISK